MESVLDLDFVHTARLGEKSKNDPAEVAKYWLNKALYEADGGVKQFPPPPVDEESLKFRLQTELRTLLDLHEQLDSTSSDDQKAVLQQLRVALSDYELAEKVFQMMGPEECQAKVLEGLAQHLVFINERQRTSWSQLVSDLEYAPLAGRLKLTDDQQAEIRVQVEKASLDFKHKIGKLTQELSDASSDRWKKLLRLLDSEQEKFAKTRIGKPIEWHRAIRKLELRRVTYEQFVKPHYELVPAIDEKRWMEQSIKNSPELRNAVFVEQLVHAMLGEEGIWDELELVADQREKLQSLTQGRIDSEQGSTGMHLWIMPQPRMRFSGLLTGTSELPKKIDDILLPDQLEWLRQIEFQIRTEPKYDSTVGLLDPRVIKHLKLTDQQQAEMKVIGDEFAETLRSSTEKINVEKKRIEDELESKLADLLDKEQLAFYRKFNEAPTPKDDFKNDAPRF